MDFNVRLKEMRDKRGFTQQNMADTLNTGLRNYQKYEQGERRPTYESLVVIAQKLGVSIDYLLGATDEEPADE